jgi:hypothetical protein
MDRSEQSCDHEGHERYGDERAPTPTASDGEQGEHDEDQGARDHE